MWRALPGRGRGAGRQPHPVRDLRGHRRHRRRSATPAGKPLIVDEAWGAHLPFHPDLPTWAMNAGADVCVVSVHKMGAGFEQGSVFHVQGDLVDPAHLSACADLLMTTSPNVLIYSAIDGWRRQMVQHGHDLLGAALELATRRARPDRRAAGPARARGRAARRRGLARPGPAAGPDRRRRTWASAATRPPTGCAPTSRLDMGLSDHRRILATLSMADDEQTAERLLTALPSSAPRRLRPCPARAGCDLPDPGRPGAGHASTLPRDAFFGRGRDTCPATEAVGRIAAEQITPYPPGIPAIVPGERITAEVLDYLRTGLRAGMVLPDRAGPDPGHHPGHRRVTAGSGGGCAAPGVRP